MPINKRYQVEIMLTKDRWTLLESFTRQVDAMHRIKDEINNKYALIIVRIVRQTVFESK